MNKKISRAIKLSVLGLVLILYMLPFVFVIANSFKSTKEIIASPLSLPKALDFSNYVDAYNKMQYSHAFVNSFIITTCSVGLIIVFSSMAAYIIVRRDWKVTQYLFFIMVASMIIPFQGIMIPLVKIYGSLGMLNSKWGLIYMYVGFGSSLAVFMYHGFIKAIPIELEEAALVDGASKFRIFTTVIFPLLKPVTMTIAILDILWIWNDFLLPSLVLIGEKERTLPLSTFYFHGTYTRDYGLSMAGLMLTTIPVIIVYLFAQKHIIDGVISGSIK